MKSRVNFRLSARALMDLERLCGLWGCDKTAAVERALAEADPSHMDIEEREGTQASLEPEVTLLPPRREGSAPGAALIAAGKARTNVFRQEIRPPDWKVKA